MSAQPRAATVYHAIGRRFDLVGNVRPDVPELGSYVNKLAHFYPERDGWRARAGFSPWRFARRSESVERQLEESWRGRYDVILQLQTLFAPGTDPRGRSYTVFTDNTYSLTKRHFPTGRRCPRASRAAGELEALTCRQARYVFVPSELVRETMIADYGCEPERVVKVGFGTAIYEPHSPARRWARRWHCSSGSSGPARAGPRCWRPGAVWRRERRRRAVDRRAQGRATREPAAGYALARICLRARGARRPLPARVGVRAAVDIRPVPERAARGDGPWPCLRGVGRRGDPGDHRAGRDGPRGARGRAGAAGPGAGRPAGRPGAGRADGTGCPCRPDLVADLGPRGSAHGSLHRRAAAE